jgi:predicted Ser/Thr protein kinase
MKTSVLQCPRCHSAIPADAPSGICPACVLGDAAAGSEPGTATHGRLEIPTLESVREAFPQLEVLELLGSGGMGVVYHARQPLLDRHVALKLLPVSLSRDPAFAERFNREARFLARLTHPNIVSVYEFGQAGGFCYLLMEFVDGMNLREAMRTGRFSPAESFALIPGICDALQYAHSQGVLHRDIKPENLLLDGQGHVKIADFGVAKLVGEDPRDITLTQAGARVGTPHYMAPEQVEHPSEVDHRADIYSLGVVLYELLTGELPLGRFGAPSTKAYLDARVDAIVLRALAKERELRQQSAGEVKGDVEGLGSGDRRPPDPSATTALGSRWGTGRVLGIPVLRGGPNGPETDWRGLGIAWVGLVALFVPLALLALVMSSHQMLAERISLAMLAVPLLLCPALLLLGLVAGKLRNRHLVLPPPTTDPSPPTPAWIQAIPWLLLAWVVAWCILGLPGAHAPAAGVALRRVNLGGEILLLPACVALWSGHRGWRRLATVISTILLSSLLVSEFATLLIRLFAIPSDAWMPAAADDSLGRSPGGSVAFLGSLLVLWAPRLAPRFLPAQPWIPVIWRSRWAALSLSLALLVAIGSSGIIAFQAPRYESESTVVLGSPDALQSWGQVVATTTERFPDAYLLFSQRVSPDPVVRILDPSALDQPPGWQVQYQVTGSAPTPEAALGAAEAALAEWQAAAPESQVRIVKSPRPPVAVRAPFGVLVLIAWLVALLTALSLYLWQPWPQTGPRIFRGFALAAGVALALQVCNLFLR